MIYRLSDIPQDALLLIIDRVEKAVTVLREALESSPAASAFAERMNFVDASASTFVDADEVPVVDLVHYDSHLDNADVRSIVERSHIVLRIRRAMAMASIEVGWLDVFVSAANGDFDLNATPWFAHWAETVEASSPLSPILRTAIVIDAWNYYCCEQSLSWLGRQSAAAFFRSTNAVPHYLALNAGFKLVSRQRYLCSDQTSRIVALLHAIERSVRYEIKEHTKLAAALIACQRMVVGRRSNSKLPRLLKLASERPIISVPIVVKELGISSVSARDFIRALQLRETTGRGRDCLWSLV